MNPVLKSDIESFEIAPELAIRLHDTKIIVTGATGLIGSMFVRCVNALGQGVRFILPVRNQRKAQAMFTDVLENIEIIECDIKEFFSSYTQKCDYIIHCASPTDGKYMSAHPAETYLLAVESTKGILDYALRVDAKGMVYLSSIEYYGQIFDNKPVTEGMAGYIDPQAARSCYGLGKQSAEYLCRCYAKEYGVAVKTARLTQTFGAGISPDDRRVFAQFARSIVEGRDIVLHTEGRSAKPYCYTTDCISALLFILIKGESGEAYNVATPGTYLTIRELAELCRDRFNPGIEVTVEMRSDTGYAPETTVNLSSDRLLQLGWRPRLGMEEMLARLIEYLKTNN